MSVVGALALLTGLACFYFGARELRFRRAIVRVNRRDDPAEDVTGIDDAPTAWLLPPEDRDEMPDDPSSGVSLERGVILLVFGAIACLFGLFSF
ncbi:hypothetical protein C499_11691 [Halogeometricum borinquense DSM 11551]|uniref:Uncharacterized protein n=2 Tax=Halogeometricum borinquense TaxID=60847 RepID=E4NSX7_HALBP|nr:hypothetical protein [Halogeometricum borinquense]ADQ65865.1 hypothetical protein Hbor_02550 [Halogeometricum borinquense DSM 11551]ELY26867.1 hypothetical protein C499_11691 [Halogeometricum borinquense DSM 11551]RYJ14867.1 hypothetical protein ELS19_13495 [Halogeometricum borinquense]